MSLNFLFVFIFVFLGAFTLLLGGLPAEFYVETTGFSGFSVQDKDVVDYFDARNMVVYNYTVALDNSTNPFLHYGESQSFSFGLPEGQKIEFWWDFYDVAGYTDLFQVRHTSPGPFGWWTNYHILNIDQPYFSNSGMRLKDIGLDKDSLVALWDEEYDAAFVSFSCDHITVSMFVFPYQANLTLAESWDVHYLGVMSSYDVDWESMKPSAFSLLANILLFQGPNLGMTGVGGEIISYLLASVLWGCIALLAFAIITALVPFVPGWRGGD